MSDLIEVPFLQPKASSMFVILKGSTLRWRSHEFRRLRRGKRGGGVTVWLNCLNAKDGISTIKDIERFKLNAHIL
ncbi:MAG: hypothetical protein EAS48_00365 [Chryseobacterium sp.]|nr:MAG: hypothetical protein EAS48_00365 [Chryseobacterium sp.]